MIYLDNAATTKVRKEVVEAMMPYIESNYGNPSSVYRIGRENKEAIEVARDKVAEILNAKASEIYFTSCGTEADNWAIKGIAEAYKKKGNHIITSKIEHHAVLDACKYLEKNGYEVTYVDVDEDGVVKLDELKKAIKDTTTLITIMYANNEVGTVQPISEIADIAMENGIKFHTDAVQAVGHLKIDVVEQKIDALSISAHKFNGPKGVGVLYLKRGIGISKYLHGGAQERNKRAGTENVAYIVGLAKALELAEKEREEEYEKISNLRDYFIKSIEEKIDHVKLNGHREKRLPGNVNFSFRFIEGESILLMLDMEDIAASSGSACASGSLDPSHVLLSLGLNHETAHGSIRFSLGRFSTKEEVDKVLEVLPKIIERLRGMSPLYDNYLQEEK